MNYLESLQTASTPLQSLERPSYKPDRSYLNIAKNIWSIVKFIFTALIYLITCYQIDLREKKIENGLQTELSEIPGLTAPIAGEHLLGRPLFDPSSPPPGPQQPSPIAGENLLDQPQDTPLSTPSNPPAPSSPSPIGVNDPIITLPNADILKMVAYLGAHFTTSQKTLRFKMPDQRVLTAYFQPNTHQINIQMLEVGEAINADNSRNKLSLFIDDLGNQVAIETDGIIDSNGIPSNRINWVKQIITISKDGIPRQYVHTKENFKTAISHMFKWHSSEESTKMILTDLSGDEYVAWTNNWPGISLFIQPTDSYTEKKLTKRTELQFDQGKICAIKREGISQQPNSFRDHELEVLAAMVATCKKEIQILANRDHKGIIPGADTVTKLFYYLKEASTYMNPTPTEQIQHVTSQFSSENIKILYHYLLREHKGHLQGLNFECVGVLYHIWISDYPTLREVVNIQNYEEYTKGSRKDKAGIKIDPGTGNIISMKHDSQDKSEIPSQLLPRFEAAFTEVIKSTTTYKRRENCLRISYIRSGITRSIDLHLQQYSDHIRALIKSGIDDPKLVVIFDQVTGQAAPGVDAGGLSRAHIEEMVTAMMDGHHKDLTFIQRQNLNVPCSKSEFNMLETKLPNLTPSEIKAYQDLGLMMMHCYRSTSEHHYTTQYTMGVNFSPSLFEAILALKPEEIDTDQISPFTLYKLIDILMKQDENAHLYRETFRFLTTDIEELTDEDLTYAFRLAIIDEVTTDWEEACEKEIGELDLEKVKDNWTGIQLGLYKKLLQEYGREIRPIFELARGMRDVSHLPAGLATKQHHNSSWSSQYQQLDPYHLADKTQGSLDPKIIADSIEYNLEGSSFAENRFIHERIIWMKEWILDEKTPTRDLQNFLKLISGSPSLPAGKKITVKRRNGSSPLPQVQSCSLQIDLYGHPSGSITGYNNFSKEAFIKALLFTTYNTAGFEADGR